VETHTHLYLVAGTLRGRSVGFDKPRRQSGETLALRITFAKPSRSVGIESNDNALLMALRDGDERVFRDLVERWSGLMLRLALAYVESRAIAEEVVQDAWLIVWRSLDRFEGRSTPRMWVLGIAVNLARSRSRAERRGTRARRVKATSTSQRSRLRDGRRECSSTMQRHRRGHGGYVSRNVSTMAKDRRGSVTAIDCTEAAFLTFRDVRTVASRSFTGSRLAQSACPDPRATRRHMRMA
jgi:RNA polymerase sigma factor (sigma-70 family)